MPAVGAVILGLVADPIQDLLAADTGAAWVGKAQENFRRRKCWDFRVAMNIAATQTTTDEQLRVSATTAPRALQLLTADLANALLVIVTAADAVNTYTILRAGADTIDGATSLVLTAPAKLFLIPDGVSGWIVFKSA